MKTLKITLVSLAVAIGLTACSTASTPTSASDMLNQPIGTEHTAGMTPPLSVSTQWIGATSGDSVGSVPSDGCEPTEICDSTSVGNVPKPGNSEAKTTPEKITEKALSEISHGATTGQTDPTTSENRPPVNAEITEPMVEPSAGEITGEELAPAVLVEPVENGLLPCAKTSEELAPYGHFSYLHCDDGTTQFNGFTTDTTDTTVGTVVCDPHLYEKAKGCLVAQGSGWRFVTGSEAMKIVVGDSNV